MEIKVTDKQPNERYCVGCASLIPVSFNRSGRIYTVTSFRTIVKEEAIFDPKSNQVVTERTEKKFPVMEWVRGLLCEQCASDYSNIKVKHRDGSVTWKSRVIVDPRPTEHTTINPGYTRYRDKCSVETRPVDKKFAPCEGSGSLMFDTLTWQIAQEVQ